MRSINDSVSVTQSTHERVNRSPSASHRGRMSRFHSALIGACLVSVTVLGLATGPAFARSTHVVAPITQPALADGTPSAACGGTVAPCH